MSLQIFGNSPEKRDFKSDDKRDPNSNSECADHVGASSFLWISA
jgi:hypothetical protein